MGRVRGEPSFVSIATVSIRTAFRYVESVGSLLAAPSLMAVFETNILIFPNLSRPTHRIPTQTMMQAACQTRKARICVG